MVSAAGSGELLFTPRIGSMYGYALVWALLAAVSVKWFINREIGRFAVCTGKPILEGFATLPGPRGWALWVVLVPQAFVAVTAIAGLAGSAATALTLALPGDARLWTVASILLSTALVVWGGYKRVEIAAMTFAVALGIASVAAAVSVSPALSDIAAGLRPAVPPDIDYGEVLPWLGFMLSGAAGMMWYSYWVVEKGYGAAGSRLGRRSAQREGGAAGVSRKTTDHQQLRGWIAQMTVDNTVAVAGTLIIVGAFLVLGTELLRPRGLVPEEQRVAAVLGQLLGTVWGAFGFWFMVAGVFIGFWDTVMSDQDGHSRLFANGTASLARDVGWRGRWVDERWLRRMFGIVLVTACPIALYLATGEPVGLLKIAGAVEAAHIPFVTVLTLVVNRRVLPRELQPSWPVFAITAAAAVFFAVFAALYVVGLKKP